MRSLSLVLLAFALVGTAACDTKATASDPAVVSARAEQRSREFETCASSLHCRDGLRCFDHECRRSERSTVGDYFAAAGAAARARGDHEAAITAYASALGHYDAEKVKLPVEIDCAYGGALAAAKARKAHAELGARVLHRCVLAAPSGSALRARAIAELATLGDVGLDPVLLGAGKTADLYLTKGPVRPATDKLVVSATAAPQPAKTFPLITAALAQPDIKRGLIACWEQYNAAAKKLALATTIGLKVSYSPSAYEDEPGRFSLKIDPPVALPAGPEATADGCVRQVLEPAIEGLKIAERFTTKLTVTVK